MAASPTIAMGAELEVIQTELLGFKSLAGDAQVQLTTAWSDEPPNHSSLLTIAPRRALVAAAGPNAIIIVKTEAVRKAFESPRDGESEARSLTPLATVPVSMRVTQVAFTTDEKYLLVSGNNGNGVAAYETTSLVNGGTDPAFELSPGGAPLRVLSPNVALEKAELCAVVTEAGALHMINLQTRTIGDVLVSDVSCVSWSTKGKQLVAGRSNGTVQQLTPEGDVKAEIPCPDYLSGVHVSTIQWLENHLFVAIYMSTNESPPSSTYYVITRKPPANYTFRKISDPVDPFGAKKTPHHSILRLKDFPPNLQDLLVVTSTVSPDVGLLTRSKTPLSSDFDAEAISGVFTMTEMLDDTRRAALPMTANFDNSIPVGVAMDLSARDTVYKPIPSEEIDESPGPVPAVWVLNNEGILVAWWLIYSDSIKDGATYPAMAAMLPDLDTALEAANQQPSQPSFAAVSAPSALVAAPPATSTPSAFGSTSTSTTSTFGALASTAPTTTPAFGAPSAFGAAKASSPWASSSGAIAKPTFGQPSAFGNATASTSPALGQPSSMGAGVSAITGAKSSPFGASGSTPAFGQSGFASYSTSKPAFGSASTSATSPFGSAAKSRGGFSSFASSSGSGFGALGGGDKGTSGSIFGQSSTKSAFGSASSGESIFQKADSSGSPFGGGASVFKLQSSFKPAQDQDNESSSNGKTSGLGGSMFGGGFGAALTGNDKPVEEKKTVTFKDDKEETKKAEAPKSVFGASPSTTLEKKSSFGTASGAFGAPKPATSIFGAPPTEEKKSIFGAPKTEEPKSIFVAPPAEEKKSIFGQPSTPLATQSTFGKSSFGAPSTPSNMSIFGASTLATEESTTPATAKTEAAPEAPKSIFGAPSSGIFGASGQKKSIFGDPSTEESTSPEFSAGKTKSVFGASPTEESTTPQTEAPKTKSMFGAPSTPQSIFGPPPKVVDAAGGTKSIFGSGSTFGASTTSGKSIFGAPSASTSGPKSCIFGSSTTPQKSIFSSTKSETPKNIFSSPPSTTTPKTGASRDSIFGGSSSNNTPSGTPSTNPFASLKPIEDDTSEDDDNSESEEETTTPAPKEKGKKMTTSGKKGGSIFGSSTTPAKSSSIFSKTATTPPSKSSIFAPAAESPENSKTPVTKIDEGKTEHSIFSDSTTPTSTPAPLRFSYRSSQNHAPAPPESTSKNSYEVGTSSSSASKVGVSDDDSTFLKPKVKASGQSESAIEDAPLPPDPRTFVTKTPAAAAKALPSDNEGSGVEVAGPGEESDLDSETSSAVHVSKDISPKDVSPSSSARTQNSFTSGLNGGFTMVTKPAAPFTDKKEKKSIFFGDTLSKPSSIFPPLVNQTSPRSPSPVRNASTSRVMRIEGSRSVSSPHMGSSSMGRPAVPPLVSKPLGSSILGSTADGQTAQDAFLSANRKVKAKQDLQEAAPLVDDEGDEVQRLLASKPIPTLQIDQLMAHTDVAPPAQDSIPAQVEAVYRDINSMVDTIGLNARSVKQFVLGHSQPLTSDERTADDLAEDADGWVLCELEDLADIIEVDLATDLANARVTDVEGKKSEVSDLSRSLSRLRAKQQDLEVIMARLDPTAAESAANLPLSPEQSAQQSELRRGFATFTRQLAAVEEALSVLKTRVASAAAVNGGKGATQPPTVDAVMRTIAKMTSMAEKRSGDVDVLDTQLRKLRLSSPVRLTRESTPAINPPGASVYGSPRPPRTPQRPTAKRSLFSPERSRCALSPGPSASVSGTPWPFNRTANMTPVREFGSSSIGAGPTPLGVASPARKKVSGYSVEEKKEVMGKAARKRAVLGKLKARVVEKGVTVWEMETTE